VPKTVTHASTRAAANCQFWTRRDRRHRRGLLLEQIGLEVLDRLLEAFEARVRGKGDRLGHLARVEQAADDGELWASSTVRDMMLGGDATFVDRGEHTLKGIDGSWRLFAREASG